MSDTSARAVDYIVVGAGSAGCVMAARLSEDAGSSVLLLEAGGSDDHLTIRMPLGFLSAMTNPRFAWGFMSEPEPALGGRPLWVPRGRVLGGCSSINGMFYMRGHPRDFDEWRELGCEGWDIRMSCLTSSAPRPAGAVRTSTMEGAVRCRSCRSTRGSSFTSR